MVTVETKTIDLLAFQAGLFTPIGENDMLSPVEIWPEAGGIYYNFQRLEDVQPTIKRTVDQFLGYAVTCGIAQYSLQKDEKIGLLADFSTEFREPCIEEARKDFDNFGNQVLGRPVEEISDEERSKPLFATISFKDPLYQIAEKRYEYTGPPRLLKSIFATKVFHGDIPSDISDIVKEVDSISPKSDEICSQGYQFFHADKGKIKYSAFRDPSKFDPRPFGEVYLEDKKLMFNSAGRKDQPKDFSEIMYRRW